VIKERPIHHFCPMSRAFTPPDTLSKDDLRTLAEVRRDIWTNAMKGLCIGTVSGYSLYSVIKFGHQRKWWKVSFINRNTAFLSVLLGGAIGSFIMSVTTGKNEVHKLHPIFALGSNRRQSTREDSDHLSPYEISILQAKERADDIRAIQKHQKHSQYSTLAEQEVLDRVQREKNRLYRRASLTKSLEQDGGLSDAHGGNWITDDNDGQLQSDNDDESKG
jgi:hypothetical protein